MKRKGVFCDTSFFIRLLSREDFLHANAKSYFRYFSENQFDLYISTIAIAEYCTGGNIADLPLRNLQIIPFNFDQALRTSEFARIAFQHRHLLNIKERRVIPNDMKLFAQADVAENIDYYISSDSECKKIYNLIQDKDRCSFEFIDLSIPYNETFGLLNLGF